MLNLYVYQHKKLDCIVNLESKNEFQHIMKMLENKNTVVNNEIYDFVLESDWLNETECKAFAENYIVLMPFIYALNAYYWLPVEEKITLQNKIAMNEKHLMKAMLQASE